MAVASAGELPAVKGIVIKIQSLLALARTVKPQTTINPPLPVADFLPQVQSLHNDLPEQYDQIHRFSLVETATRDVFYALIRTTDIDDPEFVTVWNLLDITLMCGDNGMCTPELVCWLLEELLDSQTTHGCRRVFDYLELRRERLAQKDFHKKNLVFLRSCNELLRRLSRAEDANFCGRVFFFLFQTFPLGDKSSVNLRGEFHVDNTTTFDADDTADDHDDEMDVDATPQATTPKQDGARTADSNNVAEGKRGGNKDGGKKNIEEAVLPDHQLYPIFWRLQHDFSNPTRLYDSENFTAFKKGLTSTIAKFKKSPTVVQTKIVDDDRKGMKRAFSEDDEPEQNTEHAVDNYNPKYLTSRDLFHLELSDLAFQRHILVQALILIDFLLSLTEAAKKRRDTLSLPNKSLLYAYTLNDEDAKWATATRSEITSYLSATRDGREYCRMIETVLARDKNWIRWKMESCPSIVRGPVSTETELAARKAAQETTRPRRVSDRPMGAMNIGFLDEDSTGVLPALKTESRLATPSVKQLVDGIKMDQLDAEMATDEEAALLENSIANKKWRALRKARATDLALLDKVESTKEFDLEQALAIRSAQIESSIQRGEQETGAGISAPTEDGQAATSA